MFVIDTPQTKLTKTQIAMVAILICGAFISQLNQTSVAPLLPAIMAEKNMDATTAQWLVSGYNMINAILMPLSAFLMARLSTRKQFLSAFTLFSAGSLLIAWGLNFPMLLAGRFLQAICTSMLMPMVITILLLVFPPDRRGVAMGIYSLAVMLAPAVGPVVAGIINDMVGWHIFFLIMAAFAIAFIVISAFILKNFGTTKNATLDKPSVALSSLGLLCLLYGFSEFSNTELLPFAVALIIIGAIVVTLFAKRQLKLKEPMLEIRVFKNKQFVFGMVVFMILQIILAAVTIIMPIYIQTIRGMSTTTTGLILIPGAILGAAFGLAAGKLSDRFGARPLVIIGGVLLTCGSVGMALLGRNTSMLYIAAFSIPVLAGIMLTNSPMNSWTLGALPNDLISHGNAVYLTLCQVMTSLGTAIMVSIMSLISIMFAAQGNLKAQLLGVRAVFFISVLICLVEVVFVFVKVKNKPTAGNK